MATNAPRRFKVQLVETTTTSSKRSHKLEHEHESTTPSAKASRNDDSPDPAQTTTPSSRPPRKFLPTPIETTTRTHHVRLNTPSPPRGKNASHSRFRPQLLETSSRQYKQHNSDVSDQEQTDEDEAPLLPHERMVATSPSPQSARKPRRFAPQVIETARRSRRAGDTSPAILLQDKTNFSPGDHLKVPRATRPTVTPLPPRNTPVNSSLRVPQLPKPYPNRQPSIRPHYVTRANTREHCFKVPDLETVESSESEQSDPPTLLDSMSVHSDDTSASYRDATRMRESVDERFSGYLLSLAARAAEKQLREQAAAAFPNDDYHSSVAHYINREEDDVDMDVNVHDPTRRDSSDDHYALQEMQKHGEQQQKRKKTAAFNLEFDAIPNEASPWMRQTNVSNKNVIGGQQKDPELLNQRKAASPPMLGGDIQFVRCASPVQARFDVTQSPACIKSHLCVPTEQASSDVARLWNGCVKTLKTPQEEIPNPLWGQKFERPKSGGLWGGLCTEADAAQSAGHTGLVTPMRTPPKDREDPFDHINNPTVNGKDMPPTPPPSNGGSTDSSLRSTAGDVASAHVHALSEADTRRAAIEAQIDAEFDDSFITQVYNYLSLGYPSLARNFDVELGKIANIPVSELQHDDQLADARGYIRLGLPNPSHDDDEEHSARHLADNDDDSDLANNEDTEMHDEPGALHGTERTMCTRWRALRLYVREWARQQPGICEGYDNPDNARTEFRRPWGTAVRKGSWVA